MMTSQKPSILVMETAGTYETPIRLY